MDQTTAVLRPDVHWVETPPVTFLPASKALDAGQKVDWLVVFGIKPASSPDDALVGTTIREAIQAFKSP